MIGRQSVEEMVGAAAKAALSAARARRGVGFEGRVVSDDPSAPPKQLQAVVIPGLRRFG